MDDNSVVAACAAIIIAAVLKKKRKKRLVWVKTWLLERDRKGAYNNIIQELRLDDIENYRRYLRMNTDTFEELLHSVTPLLEKKATTMRKPLSVAEKLACTLRFLATGESYASLQYQFRISKSTISLFIPQVCKAIYMTLKDTFVISKYGGRVAQNI